MDETGNRPEVDPPAENTAEQPAVEASPPEPPEAKGPGKKRDWTQVALIVLSVAVVLLLASTITLAVTGNFGHGSKGDRWSRGGGYERMHDFRRCPPGGEDGIPRWRQERKDWKNRGEDGKQDSEEQAPQSEQAVPGQQQAPAPQQTQ